LIDAGQQLRGFRSVAFVSLNECHEMSASAEITTMGALRGRGDRLDAIPDGRRNQDLTEIPDLAWLAALAASGLAALLVLDRRRRL